MSNFDKIAKNIKASDLATPDAEFTKEDFVNVCMRIIGDTPPRETPKIMLPLELPKDTKLNKARLIKDDKLSPLGIVLKGNVGESYTTAVGVFNAFEVLTWLFHQDTALQAPAAD